MRSSFTLGRIAGIEIGIHYTWLVAFALVVWSLAEGYFPANYRGWPTTTYWLVGLIAALGLFVSVLVHELSHSFVALARGQGVDSITLFIFGGVSNLKREAQRPQDEFLVAVVGPLTSLILAGLFALLSLGLAPGRTPAGAILGYLAFVNLAVGVFNLLPGFPLDGGRVLRSIVWALSGSLRRSTAIASSVGQGFGLLLIFWGVWQLLRGDVLGGLWIAFIGWFLNNAAESIRGEQQTAEHLRGVKVAALMNPSPMVVPPDLTVQDFVFEYVVRRGYRAVLVQDDGQLLGIISITDVKELPQEQWPTTTVAAAMTPAPLKTVSPDDEITSALRMLVDGTLNQLPVVENGRLVGMLSRADILRFLQLRDELHLQPRGAGPGAVTAADTPEHARPARSG